MSDGVLAAILIGGAALLAILYFLSNKVVDSVFLGGYGLISGGTWAWAIFILIGLWVPPVRSLVSYLLQGMIGNEKFSLPQTSSLWFWLLLVICLFLSVGLWCNAETYRCYGFGVKALTMIFCGVIRGIVLYLIVGVAVRLAILAVLGLIAYGFMKGTSETKPEDIQKIEEMRREADNPPKSEEKKVEVWREVGFTVQHYKVSSDGERYYDPDDGEWHRIP